MVADIMNCLSYWRQTIA